MLRGRRSNQSAGSTISNKQLEERLTQGVMALNLDVSADAIAKLVLFVGMISKWCRIYNLTSVRKPEDILRRHILDSLTIVPYLDGERLLDIGTGAGLPGIPLAICRPDITVTLLDSSAKKLRFVRQAMADLELNNVRVRQSKIEEYKPVELFDTVVCRAFSSIADILKYANDVCARDGIVLAMKGVYPVAEIDAMEDPGWVREVEPVSIPGLDAERHVVILRDPQQ